MNLDIIKNNRNKENYQYFSKKRYEILSSNDNFTFKNINLYKNINKKDYKKISINDINLENIISINNIDKDFIKCFDNIYTIELSENVILNKYINSNENSIYIYIIKSDIDVLEYVNTIESYILNQINIFIMDNNKLNFYKLNNESNYYSEEHFNLNKSELNYYNYNKNTKFSRNTVYINNYDDNKVSFNQINYLNDNHYNDTVCHISYLGNDNISEVNNYNLLMNKSVASFYSLLDVKKNTKNNKATQKHKNMLLDNSVNVFSKPQLVIGSKDIQCSHGSTFSNFREEEIQYIMSRGISYNSALNMLLNSVLNTCLEKINNENIKELYRKFY